MRNPLLATKVRNNMNKLGNYDFKLKNILINGQKRGCSGFITNKDNGNIAYVTTEPLWQPLFNQPIFNTKVMYRAAISTTDYTGGYNQWVEEKDFYVTLQNFLDRDDMYEFDGCKRRDII